MCLEKLNKKRQPDPLKTYLIVQLTTAKKQLRLIDPNGDIEALHRFRVALRRFRSLIHTYAKDLYAPDAVAKSMLSATNPLREIDVFLASLERNEYPNLWTIATEERRKLYRERWNSGRVERFEHALSRLLSDLSHLTFEVREKKLRKRAGKLHERVKAAHKMLHAKSPESEIHAVRLQYKQVRYAMEFLTEARLSDEHKTIKQVKKVLDHFGAVQDAVDQLRWLDNFCTTHPDDECSRLLKVRKKQLKALKKAF